MHVRLKFGCKPEMKMCVYSTLLGLFRLVGDDRVNKIIVNIEASV